MATDLATPTMAGRTDLHIGELDTRLVAEPAQGPSLQWVLPIGWLRLTGGAPMRHEPPTALEIEHAIETVEDAVMPLSRQWPTGTQLQTSDAAARVLHTWVRAQVAGPANALLSLDDVEHAFNELAALSTGRPLASSSWPAHPGLAAYLVVLREAMHHLRFTSIALV